jgi:N-acetylneuraminic acid mutarotase
VASLNDTIYVIACYGLSYQSLKMAKYDSISDSWLVVASPIVERRNAQIVAANGKIYAIGGTSMEADDVVSTIEEYNPSTDQWQEIESMPTARRSTGLVTLEGDIYVIGGSESPSGYIMSPLGTVEVRSGD